jgi:hypothetical protein
MPLGRLAHETWHKCEKWRNEVLVSAIFEFVGNPIISDDTYICVTIVCSSRNGMNSYYTSCRNIWFEPIPVTALSKAWVSGRSLAVIVGSNTACGMDVCLLRVLCVEVEVHASGWTLVQRSPNECGVNECDREASKGEAMAQRRVSAPHERKRKERKNLFWLN